MTQQELMIQILTRLDATGLNAAKNGITQVTTATNAQTAAQEQNNLKVHESIRAQRILESALHGNWRALGMMSEKTTGVNNALTIGIPLVGAFWAGWEGGKKIGDWLYSHIPGFITQIEKINTSFRAARLAMEALDDTSMSKAKKEITDTATSLDRLLSQLNKINAQTTEINNAKQTAEMAALRTQPPSAERDRHIAALERTQQLENENKKLADQKEIVNTLETELKRMEAQRKTIAEGNYNEKRKAKALEEIDPKINATKSKLYGELGKLSTAETVANYSRQTIESTYSGQITNIEREQEKKRIQSALDAAQEELKQKNPDIGLAGAQYDTAKQTLAEYQKTASRDNRITPAEKAKIAQLETEKNTIGVAFQQLMIAQAARDKTITDSINALKAQIQNANRDQ
jgi:DNA repair exonuclease SbcCD ATPase subunit